MESTPRKRIKHNNIIPNERKAGAPAFIRPKLRACGLIDVWFHDSRGRIASQEYVEYLGGGNRLTGEMIARAARHHDAMEIKRVNSYNLERLVYLIRRYNPSSCCWRR